MTYNVFSGTLNTAQSINLIKLCAYTLTVECKPAGQHDAHAAVIKDLSYGLIPVLTEKRRVAH